MILSDSNDKKVEILNDHYKDTCLRLAGYRKQRNRLVFYAAITMFITMFLVFFPTEMLRIMAAFFLRTPIEDLIKNADDSLYNLIVKFTARLIPGFILMTIAFTYKHYRIAIDTQFAYVKMLESELNSLYPESNLFNRETNFSLKESNSFAMWSSQHYSKVLVLASLFTVIVYATLCTPDKNEINIDEVFVGVYGILASLSTALFFGTKRPLTDANIKSLLTSGREIE